MKPQLRFWVLSFFLIALGLVLSQQVSANGTPAAQVPATITVSGFTGQLAVVNGVYVPNGTVNDAPQWSFTTNSGQTASIIWTGVRWEFSFDAALSAASSVYGFKIISYRGSITAPPCDGWLSPHPSTIGTPVLDGGCASLTPPANLTSVNVAGLQGFNIDFNGSYTWNGTLNGVNVWIKAAQIVNIGTVYSLLFWSGSRWEIFSDTGVFANNIGGLLAYNIACPQSQTILPCGGWESTKGNPVVTGDCTGTPQTIPATTASSLTFVSDQFTLSLSQFVLTQNGTANGAPRWTGEAQVSDGFGAPTSLSLSLQWVGESGVSWRISQTATAIPPSQPATTTFLNNTGGSINALPVNGWVSSDNLKYRISVPFPLFVSQPTCQTTLSACAGVRFQLPLTVNNATTYQWLKDGVPVTGQTSATLTLSDPQSADGGVYSLSATGTYGSRVSNLFTLTVNATPANLNLTGGTLTCATPSLTLTASANGGTSYTFSGGIPLGNGQIHVSTPGTYSVLIGTVSNCTASASATVNSNTAIAALLVSSASGLCVGNSATLTASGGGPGATYIFAGPGQSQSGLTNTLSTTQTGSYALTATGTNGCTATISLMLNVALTPSVVITLPNGSTVSVAGNLPTLTLPPSGPLVLQVSGGSAYERLMTLDRVNGFEIRQVDQNTTGIFPITQTGLCTLTVTGANGCSRTVQGVVGQ